MLLRRLRGTDDLVIEDGEGECRNVSPSSIRRSGTIDDDKGEYRNVPASSIHWRGKIEDDEGEYRNVSPSSIHVSGTIEDDEGEYRDTCTSSFQANSQRKSAPLGTRVLRQAQRSRNRACQEPMLQTLSTARQQMNLHPALQAALPAASSNRASPPRAVQTRTEIFQHPPPFVPMGIHHTYKNSSWLTYTCPSIS